VQSGGSVQETVQADDRPMRMVFEVEDTGPGVAEGDRERIFSHFEQLTVGSRTKGGSGLGLAISKAYVELMGGTIGVLGELGVGSIFRFDILTREVTEEASLPVPIRRQVTGLKAGQRELRILVADDNEANREILTKLLESVGFLVREAADGREACTAFAAWHPDLILMDLVMPVMDGFEAIKEIRCSPEGKKVPLIAVSASVLEEDQRRVVLTGADAFLKKPFTEEETFGLIEEYLGIEYVYADEPVEPLRVIPGAHEPSPFLPNQLPHDLIAGLQEAAITLDVDRLYELLPRVAEHDAKSAERLRELIESYDFKILKDLLKGDKI
jgi:CheY-like chemotaxis protein